MTANRSWPTPPSRGMGLAASTHGEGTPVQLAPQAPTSNNELHFRAGTHSGFPASNSLQSTYDLVATTVLSGRPTDHDRHCPDGRNRASPRLGIRGGRASLLPRDFDGVFRQVVRMRLEWTLREGKPLFPES